MALPKIMQPTAKMQMPSQKKEVTFRPFLVGEEKVLLIAQASGEDRDIVLAVKQILNNVIQDAWFDPKMLTTFDLEYMFIKLRAASVSNMLELSYIDNEDGKKYDFRVDLNDVELTYPEGEVKDKVAITDEIGVILKWPTVEMISTLPDGTSDAEVADALIRGCISAVYDADTVYPAKDHTDEELNEFIDSMSTTAFAEIRQFLSMAPSVVYTIKYKNSLGNDRTIELKTLKDFFTWA